MLTQLNLQPYFGGGEVYTAFLCRALDLLGEPTRLIVHPQASYWEALSLPPNTELIIADLAQVGQSLTDQDRWLLGHGPLPRGLLDRKRLCTAIAHMPIQERSPEPYRNHDMVFPVSNWVQRGLVDAGLPTWGDPLYGVADLEKRDLGLEIKKTSRYDWDYRKVRDHLLGRLEPLVEPFLSHPQFERKGEMTIGVVSRITPIKQFPLLFSVLSPVLEKYPQINIEIFGSGGFASIRDLDQAVRSFKDRVRFWGHQKDIAGVYQKLDYLMTGLPEKEALGLNVIEAQASGVPVLAPNAEPFAETIVDNVTGFLYKDPRVDNGKEFSKLLQKLLSLSSKPDPCDAVDHLNRFSLESFAGRLDPILSWANRG